MKNLFVFLTVICLIIGCGMPLFAADTIPPGNPGTTESRIIPVFLNNSDTPVPTASTSVFVTNKNDTALLIFLSVILLAVLACQVYIMLIMRNKSILEIVKAEESGPPTNAKIPEKKTGPTTGKKPSGKKKPSTKPKPKNKPVAETSGAKE